MNESFREKMQEVKLKDELSEMFDRFCRNYDTFLTNPEVIKNLTFNHVETWVNENRKSSKVYSKKACLRVKKQKFFIHEKDKKTYLFFRAEILKKNIMVNCASIYYVSTETKGNLYFLKYPDYPEISCFFAHFFDRIAQRLLNNKERAEAIKKYLEGLKNNTYIYHKNGNVEIVREDGLVLGRHAFFEKKDEPKNEQENIIRFITHQTFISNELLYPEQKKLCESARQGKLKSNDDFIVECRNTLE